MSKIRTQIQLDPEDYSRVQSFARQRGLSLSGAVRLLIRQALQPQPAATSLQDAIRRIAGSGHDKEGRTDVARRHDEFLYEP